MTSMELFAAAKLVDGYLDDPEISSMLMRANWWVDQRKMRYGVMRMAVFFFIKKISESS